MSFLTDTIKNLGNTVGGTTGNYLGKDNPVNVIPQGRTTPLPSGDYTYADVFRQAYKRLGQPNAPEEIIVQGTQSLIDNFIDRVKEKTGKLPTEQQINDFVGQNLTVSYAEKFITGLPSGTLKANVIDPYIAADSRQFPPIGTDTGVTVEKGVEDRLSALKDRLRGFYEGQRGALKERVEESYGEQKGAIARDLAGQGMIYNQPASRGVFDRLEQAKGRSMTQGLATLGASEAEGSTDIAKTVEGLLANERRADEGARQFGLNYFLNKRGLDADIDAAGYDRSLNREALGVAERVGKAQGQKNRDWLDYANTAIGGLNVILQGAGAIAGGDSNESFCSLVAIKNVLKELGITTKMSEIFKVIEDNGFIEIDYGVLIPEHIIKVLEHFGAKVQRISNAKLNGSKSPTICVVHCKDYYGVNNEKWLHAVVVTPERKVIDGYEVNLLSEYDNGQELVDHSNKFDWDGWVGDYFLVSREK